MRITGTDDLDRLDFERGDGLLPVTVQHARTGEVLMLAYANRDAVERSLTTGVMWYWSRSRARLWKKGETSGNVQQLVSLHTDCDADALLAHVSPAGPSCHTGSWSCFEAPPTLPALERVLAARDAERPDDSYTARLLADPNLRLKKLGEEAVELALACTVHGMDAQVEGYAGDRQSIAAEAADLLYHTLVAAYGAGTTPAEVIAALDERLPDQLRTSNR